MYMYHLVERSFGEYDIIGGIIGENYKFNCSVDNKKLCYDPVISIESDISIYNIRLSNSKEFVNMVKEGSFEFASLDEVNNPEFDIEGLIEIFNEVSYSLREINVDIEENYCFVEYNNKKIILFNDIGIPLDLFNENFDLNNFFKLKETFGTCNYCSNICHKYYICGSYKICKECFKRINLKCSEICGNEELENELIQDIVSTELV